MIINKINYEEYIVSSLEGVLNTEEQSALDAFLREHPELNIEVEMYKRTFLVPDKSIAYPYKSSLLKQELSELTVPNYSRNPVKINRLNYEEYVVRSMEGMLSIEEQASLDAFLYKHTELKMEADAYKLTFLKPDKSIVFKDKHLLMKPEAERALTPFYKRYSVLLSMAATILLLLVFRIFLYNDFSGGKGGAPAAFGQSYSVPVNASLPGRQKEEYFIPSTGNPQEVKMVDNSSFSNNQNLTQQSRIAMNEVATLPVKNAVYIPQQQSRRIASLQANSSETAQLMAEHLKAQRTQSTLISNAAAVGKTLLHLSGRQLPSENEAGQQFRVVQVNYNSKDFSFVRIIH